MPPIQEKKKRMLADLSALVVPPLGQIAWRDGGVHDVLNPIDVDWPAHLKLLHVEDNLEQALNNAPADRSAAEKMRDQLITTVEGLKGLLAPLIPSVTEAQWAECPCFDVFVLARAVRIALNEARGSADLDPMPTSQTMKETTTNP